MTMHIARVHTIELAGPVERVFPLFTPAGEESWADDWAPEYLHPATKETCQDMVFRTHHGGEETLWACVQWDPANWTTKYARVTPGSRMGFVRVECRAIDAERTKATVAYELTALTDSGEEILAGLTDAVFRAMIEDWQAKISAHLTSVRIPADGSTQRQPESPARRR